MDENLKNDFKDRESEALKSDDKMDLQFLADEIAEAGDLEWAIKLYKKSAKLAKDVVDLLSIAESIITYTDNTELPNELVKSAEKLVKQTGDFANLGDYAAKFISYKSALNYYDNELSQCEKTLKKGVNFQGWDYTEKHLLQQNSALLSSIDCYIFEQDEYYLGKLQKDDIALANSLVKKIHERIVSILDKNMDLLEDYDLINSLQYLVIDSVKNLDLVKKLIDSLMPFDSESDKKNVTELIADGNLKSEDKTMLLALIN